jgi:hypothetical protein
MIERERETTRTADEPLATADIAATGDQREKRDQHEEMQKQQTMAESGGPSLETSGKVDGHLTPLLPEDETHSFQSRWSSIQTEFVDEPRGSLEKADRLVAELMKRLAEVFADERSSLERHWDRGEQTSTEDLRLALQRYRSFFQRLLSI